MFRIYYFSISQLLAFSMFRFAVNYDTHHPAHSVMNRRLKVCKNSNDTILLKIIRIPPASDRANAEDNVFLGSVNAT